MTPRRLLLAGLLLGLGLLLPAQALAHANLVRAEPAPGQRLDRAPGRVRAWFSEPVEPGFSSLQILDASGKPIDRGDSQVTPDDPTSLVVSLPDNVPQGIYTVSWKTLSRVDGHAVRGLYTFGIGNVSPQAAPPPPPEVTGLALLQALARTLDYLAQTLLLGGFLLTLLVLQGPAAVAFARAFRPASLVAIALLLLSALLALAIQALQVGGDAPFASLGPLLFGTRYGTIWLARVALVLTLGALVLVAPSRQGVAALGAALGAALLLTNSLNSHGAASEQLPGLAIAADWLHQVAVATWVGELFALAALLWRLDWAPPGTGRARALGAYLPRFSRLALASVPLLAVTGTYQALLSLGSWAALVDTVSGRTLLLKIILFAVMTVLGAYHFLVVQPRLSAAAAPGRAAHAPPAAPRPSGAQPAHAGTRGDVARGLVPRGSVWPWRTSRATNGHTPAPAREALAADASRSPAPGSRTDTALQDRPPASSSQPDPAARFRLTLAIEAALGALALVAAALLTSLAPAWQTEAQLAATRPLELSASAADLALTLTISPGHPGQNTYTLVIADQSGPPVAGVQKAVLRFSFLNQDLGEVEVPLNPTADGLYQAQGGELGVAGRWQAVIIVRRQGQDDARTAVRFELAPVGGTGAAPNPVASLPAPDSRMGLALLALLGGAALAWYAWRSARGRLRRAAPGLAASLLVVVIGLYVGGRAVAEAPTLAASTLTNPFPPDPASLATGKQIYDANCAVCHGDTGRGDGPAAAALRPPPADLRVHMAAGHTDAQLFNWITNGVPGTAMPAWKDKLTEDQRWHVINYIRTFAPQAAEAPPSGPRIG